jgi:hypothetical protein
MIYEKYKEISASQWETDLAYPLEGRGGVVAMWGSLA